LKLNNNRDGNAFRMYRVRNVLAFNGQARSVIEYYSRETQFKTSLKIRTLKRYVIVNIE